MFIRLDNTCAIDLSVSKYARKEAWIGDEKVELELSGNTARVTSDLIPANVKRARKVGLTSLNQVAFSQEGNSITFNVEDVLRP